MEVTFYDRGGNPIAYADGTQHIYFFNGRPAGYVDGDSIYSFSGKHLGWFEHGWVRDHRGACVYFTEGATGGGPVRPVTHVRPVKSVKSILPIKSVKSIKPVRSVDGLSWSQLSGDAFFKQ